MLPAASVHQSEDGVAYVCARWAQEPATPATIRCVFYAVGG